jgi:hypothetical protein
MGAVIAALFAAGVDPDTVLDRLTTIGENEFIQPDRFAFLRGLWARALLKPEPFRASVERLVPAQQFRELVIPLTVVATDLDTGERCWLGWGGEDAPLIDALVASCALSVHFPPVTIAAPTETAGSCRGADRGFCSAARAYRRGGRRPGSIIDAARGFRLVGAPHFTGIWWHRGKRPLAGRR